MVEDNLLVSKTISPSLVKRTLELSVESLSSFGEMYREAVVQFQQEHSHSHSSVLKLQQIVKRENTDRGVVHRPPHH